MQYLYVHCIVKMKCEVFSHFTFYICNEIKIRINNLNTMHTQPSLSYEYIYEQGYYKYEVDFVCNLVR